MNHWQKSKHVENSRELKINVVLVELVLKRAFYQAGSLARSDPYVKQSHSWNELWVCLCHSSHRSVHDMVRKTKTVPDRHDHVSCVGRASGNDSLKAAEEPLFQPIKTAAFDVDCLSAPEGSCAGYVTRFAPSNCAQGRFYPRPLTLLPEIKWLCESHLTDSHLWVKRIHQSKEQTSALKPVCILW